MSRRTNFSRRTLLRALGAGGAALGLPFLRGGSTSAQTTAPKRFLVVFTPNGTVEESWDYGPGGILEPMAAHRDSIMQLRGLDMLVSNNSPGGAHQAGLGAVLTGTRLQEGSDADTGRFPSGWPQGPSIDQAIAAQIGAGTRAESLLLGIGVASNGVIGRLSYRDRDEPLAPENDPVAVYERLFGGIVAEPGGADRLLTRRQSVLDYLGSEIDEINAVAGTEERRMLDAHLTALRNTEQRLSSLTTEVSCDAPSAPGATANPLDPANYPAVSRAQIDLMVDAFACDITRVGTLFYGGNNISFPWIGVDDQHHEISHSRSDESLEAQRLIHRWYSGEIAYLFDRMASVTDVDGASLLDNTVVLCCSEIRQGQAHYRTDMHFLLAGGGGGYFRTGEEVFVGERSGPVGMTEADPHNDLLITLLNWAGVETDVFGDPAFSNGPLSQLLA